jgi:hypothetical protein
MSIIGAAAARLDRYDWGLTLGSYALGVVAFQLGVPLWAAAIIAFVGFVIVGVRGTCRDLGLFEHRDVDEPEATPPEHGGSPASQHTAERLSARTQPSPLSLPPHAADRP